MTEEDERDQVVRGFRLTKRPIIDHDIDGGGGSSEERDPDSRLVAKKKFKLLD